MTILLISRPKMKIYYDLYENYILCFDHKYCDLYNYVLMNTDAYFSRTLYT